MSSNRDATRQPSTLVRQFERQSARAGKNAIRQESAQSFKTFMRTHNAIQARRNGSEF